VSIAREEIDDMSPVTRDPASHFFAAAVHAEALARLEHLVESGLRSGLVVGPRGTGKSTVLGVFVQACRAAGCEAVSVDVTGLDEIQFLERLAQRLGVTSQSRGRAIALWSEVTDALRGRSLVEQPCAVIIDHLDRALPDCQHLVRRLSARGGRNSAETWILSFSGRSFPMIPREWREHGDLRIELAAMSQQESYDFLQSLLEFLDRPLDALDGVAQAIVEAAAGVPAELRRLSELSLLLAAEGQARVSPEALRSVLDEIRGLRFSA
jgi:type II secretory pathway predicted ATPase ExeA